VRKRLILTYLIDLMKIGAGEQMVRAPTTYLAHIFGLSQQSASRVLSELSDLGYVIKEVKNGSVWIKLSEKAKQEVRSYINYVLGAINHPGEFVFKGRVFSGMGEGAYYMSQPGYRRQFYAALGYYPYPGTLNVRLTDPIMIDQNKVLRMMRGMQIRGFRDKSRTFGDVKLYPAVIMDSVEGAVIYAERSIYGPDVVELISKHNLRRKLNLTDGTEIHFRVKLTEIR